MPNAFTRPMSPFHDQRMEREFPDWGGLDPQAARRVFGDLRAYLGLPIERIAQDYWLYRDGQDAAAQRRVAEATDEATVLAYYASTPHYLYELSYWEASREKQAWFRVLVRACRKYGLRRVLDFGGGVGGLSLHLGLHGISCDYLDVPGKTFAYAAWRFARHTPDVATLEATAPHHAWPNGVYDAVIAWDVLEHLFDLESAIGHIAGLVRTERWFVSKSTFAAHEGDHLDIHLAKHACYHDLHAFNRFLSQQGFHFVGQLKPSRLSRLLRACRLRYAVAGVRIVPRLKHGGNFLIHTRFDETSTR